MAAPAANARAMLVVTGAEYTPPPREEADSRGLRGLGTGDWGLGIVELRVKRQNGNSKGDEQKVGVPSALAISHQPSAMTDFFSRYCFCPAVGVAWAASMLNVRPVYIISSQV